MDPRDLETWGAVASVVICAGCLGCCFLPFLRACLRDRNKARYGEPLRSSDGLPAAAPSSPPAFFSEGQTQRVLGTSAQPEPGGRGGFIPWFSSTSNL